MMCTNNDLINFLENYGLSHFLQSRQYTHSAPCRFRPIQFTFGGVIAERVAKTRRKVNPIRLKPIASSAPCGPGAILPYPFTSPLPYLIPYLLVSFTFLFFIPYSLYLFSCFSIPFNSTRIPPLPFPGRMS